MKILVVEDSPDIRVLVRMLLEAGGHEVLTAADGRAGVEAARKAQPDLVLMDLSLPILSGWEAARAIKDDPATSSIPVVAVTAHAMHGDRERALAAGCDGFIAKPIDEETFEPLVRSFFHPRAEEASPSIGDTAVALPRLTSYEPGRILVVDDHEEVAALIKQDLESEGHEVLVARTPDGASAIASDNSPFDL
ncbi:MAG TPA: response regulator, partial [Thermoanaerobaculia bacterium]|nr:response regulator [Thermoanaerobaculia bacterium]